MIDPLDVEAARERDTQRQDVKREAQLASDNDFRFVMADARGRRFIWSQLADAGVFRSSFATDPLVMAHSEGKRDAGLRLLDKLLRICPAEYLKMQAENTNADP